MDHSMDQQSNVSINESQDMLDVTGVTNPSPGPALVSNSSLDSPLLPAPISSSEQRPSQSDTIVPSDLVNSETTSATALSPTSLPAATNEEETDERIGVTPGLLDGGDPGLFDSGPTIREAEAYADDLTRELLNDQVEIVQHEKVDLAEEKLAEKEDDKENVPVCGGGVEIEKEPDSEPEPELEVESKLEPKLESQEVLKQDEVKSADESLIKLHDISNNELLHQTFKTAANISQDSLQQSDNESDNTSSKIMEFTKNYSDELLMGTNEQRMSADSNNEAGGHDLADFELEPPYNGSSSSGSSEQAPTTVKQSPVKQRKSSNTASTQASYISSVSGNLAPNDLTAVKNILISSYSKFAHVFHWKRPVESGIIFAIGLALIAALTYFSIISVVAYSALGVVLASAMMRIYKTSMKAFNRPQETPVDHMWEKILVSNVSMSPEKMHQLVDSSLANVNASLVYLKQVLLVEEKVATFKFFLFLYSLTYIGAWFNGLTLITIIYVSMFTVPVFYDKNKTKIDEYLDLATSHVASTVSTLKGRATSLAFGSQAGSQNDKKQK